MRSTRITVKDAASLLSRRDLDRDRADIVSVRLATDSDRLAESDPSLPIKNVSFGEGWS